jgi:CheY-like chemotaxis protein
VLRLGSLKLPCISGLTPWAENESVPGREGSMLDSQDVLSPDSRTILVVEDDRLTGEVIQLTLAEELSCHTLLVADPYEALEFAHTVKVDLWIIDYLLPGMNGLELYDRLHASKTLQDAPFILISASFFLHKDDLGERKLTILDKPFDLNVLLETVKRVVNY